MKLKIYKFSHQKDDLDIIEMDNLNLNNLEYASLNEINLENYLDIIHSNLLHDAIDINKDKCITKIANNYIINI